MEPLIHFIRRKQNEKNNPFILYRRLIAKSLGQFPLFALCTFINGFSFFLIFSSVGILLTQIVSIVSNQVGLDHLMKSAIYLIVVAFFALFSGFSMIGFTYIEQTVQSRLRREMVVSYLHSPENVVADLTPTEILNRINYDLPESIKLIGYHISAWIFQPIISGLFSVVLLFYVNWSIALLCLVCTAINTLIMKLAADRLQHLNYAITEKRSILLRFFKDCIDGFIEIHSFTLGSLFAKKLKDKLSDVADVVIKFRSLESLRRSTLFFFADCITIVALLILGAQLASYGYIEFADIMLALPLSDQIGQMMAAFSHLPSLIKQGQPNLERIFEIIDLPQEDKGCENNSENLVGTPSLEKTLIFNKVDFYYETNMILNNLSFCVKSGEKIAFVGESGSGKSTVIQLILGLYMPASGYIALGDQVLGACPLSQWRNNFAYLPQDIALFHLPIDENISLSIDSNQEAICIAARQANADSFICHNEQGYRTILEDNNAGFSGGQLQRIALARCLFRDAPVILMDEPTSALDSESELMVRDAIEHIPSDKTVIVVTHRLTLTMHFDRLYVMEKGRIIESGSHRELMEAEGAYTRLWKLQCES